MTGDWFDCSWKCPDCDSPNAVERFEDLIQIVRCSDCGWKYSYNPIQRESPRGDRNGPDLTQTDSDECPEPDYYSVDLDLSPGNWDYIEEATCDNCGKTRATANLKSFILDDSMVHICRGGCEE